MMMTESCEAPASSAAPCLSQSPSLFPNDCSESVRPFLSQPVRLSVDPLKGRYGRLMRVILAKRPNSAICSFLGDHRRPWGRGE